MNLRSLLSAALLAALTVSHAEERILNLDFAEAPEKIEAVRSRPDRRKKIENVDFYFPVPSTNGKSFTFQCLLTPRGMRAFSGVSVGIGNREMTARRFTMQIRLGDRNRTMLTFLSREKVLAKPAVGFKLEPVTFTIRYHAETNSMDFLATGKSGTEISKAEKIPVRFDSFTVNSILISVIDQPGAGEAYLSYNAEKQCLEGKSFLAAQYNSTFAVDDIRITYAE